MCEAETPESLICLHGRATNYKCAGPSASLVFAEADQTTMGSAAVAAALVGQVAHAVSVQLAIGPMRRAAEGQRS